VVTELPRLPLLAPWFRVVGDGDRLLLEYAQSLVVVEGAAVRTLLPALLPLLDGTRTVDDLVRRLGAPARQAIEGALALLAAHGAVVEGPDAPVRGRDAARAIAAAAGIPPALAAERLEAARVAVVGGGEPAVDVARLLSLSGVRATRRRRWRARGPADLVVVAPAADELDRLPAFNRSALRSGLPWLLVRPHDGRSAAIGPLVVPHQTCCYECLLLRRGANAGYPAELDELESAAFAAPCEPPVAAAAAALAAHLALRFVAARDRTCAGVVLTLETRPALRLDEHAVLRVPRCPSCSTAAQAAAPLPWHEADAA